MIGLHLRPMLADDVPSVVSLHQRAFPTFFASQLGPGFLRAFYSEGVNRGEPAHVALDGQGKVAGFVMGSVVQRTFFRSLAMRRFPALALVTLRAVARSPRVLGRLARMSVKPVRVQDPPATATLMFIAVGDDLRGLGAGKLLVEEFVRDVASRGVRRVELVTLRDANEATNDFYRTVGFRLMTVVPSADGWKNAYERSLAP